ncbi:histidinol-phosphate aminotransferase family protein [Myxococcus sp. K15C18031901]|uniref:pyridoxal phosphate-dependent aminotransferase n=1 Tax=Myxococcus dinghuensis TaxID=2906761 RepID=UPI0020A7ABBB|nr:aminotransferase class I/II-fold pyridoxal phosphate-dependent enzyme [Myxococcus dinghuensis]MCP3097986.1 histidinol-phosphate aminotransferase family protein [Myxococcus dinghuensis]
MSDFSPTRRTLLAGAAASTAGLALGPRLALGAPGARARPGSEPVRLFSNENRYGPCEGALRAIRESVHLSSRYTALDALQAFRQRVAEEEGVAPEQVLVTAGSLEALSAVAGRYALGGGGVVCSELTFPALPEYAETLGGKVTRVPLDANLAHDLDGMEARVGPGTKLVSVCNPNNPTGTIVDAKRLRDFCESVSPRATVLVDEVYLHYLEPSPANSMVDLVRAGRNVIVVRSFSKIYGLAGMRVGYALAQPDVVKALFQWRMALPNPLSIAAARASLDDKQFVPRMRKHTQEARRVTSAVLDELGLKYVAGHGNFMWISLAADQLDLPARLAPHGFHVATVPSNPIPANISALRLTLGTVEEMRAFAPALRATLKGRG